MGNSDRRTGLINLLSARSAGPIRIDPQIIRINIPMKQYATVFDSDPTDPDPNEPYYFQLGREIGLKPQEAYEAVSNLKTHGVTGTGGNGYGSWFL